MPTTTDAAFAKAAHVVKLDIINNRLVPNAMEPRAALGHYDKAEDHYTCWTTSQNPHVARLVMSAFYNVAPENKLRVIAPDVGGGFGSKIYIYPEEIVCLWASKKTGVPVKWVADRTESFLTDAHGRDHVTHAEDGLRHGQQDPRPEGRHDRQSRRLHVAVLVGDADLSLRDAAVGPVRHPGDPRQCEGDLHQHRAGRRLSRRRAAGGDLRHGAHDGDGGARARRLAGGTAAQELRHRPSRTRRRSSCATTPATTRPRSTRRCRRPTMPASPQRKAAAAKAAASCAASA